MSAIRFLPLGCLVVIAALFYWFFGEGFLNWESVRDFHATHSLWEEIFLFIGIYILYTIGSLPGLLVLDVVAGVLFGQWIGWVVAAGSATVGACAVFLAVRYAFPKVSMRFSAVQRLSKGFNKHTINYLLFLRLVPIAPFGLITMGLGLSKVSFKTFTWTTFVGVLPAAFLYTHAGTGIQHILHRQGPITIELLLNQYIVVALVGLSVLSILPVFIKRR